MKDHLSRVLSSLLLRLEITPLLMSTPPTFRLSVRMIKLVMRRFALFGLSSTTATAGVLPICISYTCDKQNTYSVSVRLILWSANSINLLCNKTYEYFSWYGGYHPSNRLQIIHYSRVFEKIYIYMMYIFTVESQAFHVWTPTGFASFMASELSRVGKSGLSRSLL